MKVEFKMWLILALIVIPFGYFLLKRPHKYWLRNGVKQGNPVMVFGDHLGIVIRTQSLAEVVQMVYNIDSGARYVGSYQFFEPILVIRDPELIKQITIKDFDHFVNHRSFIREDTDPLWSKNLFALNDQKWRDMRATLSPAFTASKMKYMFSIISESGEQFVKYFLDQNEDLIIVEMKDTFTRFTNDAIANTAFGVQCDSLREKNNEFYLMGKELTDFTGFGKMLKFMFYLLIPQFVYKFFNFTFFPKKVGNFFIKVVKDNIESRLKHNISRPDIMNLLLESRKQCLKDKETKSEEAEITKQPLSDLDITAQALLFFFGGFDSISSLMCFMSYELAVNPDFQTRLREEVDETRKKCNGKITYEALMGMKYMDMVISETLRLWPATVNTDRVCTKPFTIEPQSPEEKPFLVEKGTVVWLPIFGIHRDPNYFPEPERFDPERFNDENKNNIKPYTYIPFGSGPRNCIGSRFALLETKALFYHILSSFEIVPVEKTRIPLVISKNSFNIIAEGGFWLGLKRRQK